MNKKEIVKGLRAELSAMNTELAVVEGRRGVLKDEIRRCQKVVEMLDPSARPVKETKPKKRGVSPEKAEAVFAAVKAVTNGDGTALGPDIVKAGGFNNSLTYAALNQLREQGRVRKAGKGEATNGGAAPIKWAVIE